MALITSIAEKWTVLCRKPPVMHALPIDLSELSEPANEGVSDGGAIRAGIKTLIRNPQLLWFSLFAGLILIINVIGQIVLCLTATNREPSLIVWHTLTFVIEFATVFCLVFLLAGLVLGISSGKDGSPVSLFRGFITARKYLMPLTVWSVVLAVAGNVIYLALMSTDIYPALPVNIFGNLQIYLFNMFSGFPFNWALDPHILLEPLNTPGPHPATLIDLLGYPHPLIYTLIFSAINILLFTLTMFVVPLIVLEEKNLKNALRGSFTFMKMSWRTVAACVLGLGGIFFAVLSTSFFFQRAYAMVTPPMQLTWRPSDAWMVTGDLYVLALFIVVLIIATVGALSILNLYRSAKTGQIPESAGTGPVR